MLHSKNVAKTIIEVVEQNIENEDLCENASVVIKCLVNSLATVGDIKKLFLNFEKFHVILSLLRRYHMNEVICEELCEVVSRAFIVIKQMLLSMKTFENKSNEFEGLPVTNETFVIGTQKHLSDFVQLGGLETLIKVVKEQSSKRKIVLDCVCALANLSSLEGKSI